MANAHKLYKEERVCIFIDGANLYNAAKTLGFDIDYRKLLEFFAERARLVRAFYYTAIVEDQDYSPLRPLVDWLDYNGYTLVTKPAKEFTDSMGRRKVKGNMDVELAVDMMELADRCDHIVLFSGDGDFRRLVEAVQRKGVRVTVVSSIKTSPPMVADELRRQADIFADLGDLMPLIARAHAGPRPSFERRDSYRDRGAAERGPAERAPADRGSGERETVPRGPDRDDDDGER